MHVEAIWRGRKERNRQGIWQRTLHSGIDFYGNISEEVV